MVGKVLYIKYNEIVDGQLVEKVRYGVDRWQADDKYMGESFITFTIKSPKPIAFSVGDYCEYRGETYTLNYIPSVSQKANIGGSGEAFVYDQVKMDSPREELDRAIMLDVTPTTGDYVAALGTNYTGSSQFQLYCGETTANGKTLTPVCALAAKIQANLDRAFPDKGWKVLVDTTSTHEEAGQQVLNTHSDEKTLTFDNTTIANALAEVKNTFEIDFAVKGRTIYIGYTFGAITGNEDGSYYYFGYGRGYLSEDNQGRALFELKRTSDSGQKIVTRLRALGSTKNMPYRYYNKRYNLSQSLFPTNLQLPDTFETPEIKAKHNKERKAVYPWIRDVLGDTNDAYIDKNDNCLETVEGLREDCMRWDGSNADLKEIYPSIEEVTYGELRAALCEDQDGNSGNSAFPHYGNDERVDEILAIDTDTNVGDGILTESDSTRQTATNSEVRFTASETPSSLRYKGSAYVSPEREVMSISSQYTGSYIITNSHLWFRASYSLGRHQSENITKSCNVAYQIKVYAKDLSSLKESVICTYVSDYKTITNKDTKEYEIQVTNLPDIGATPQKIEKILLTNASDIRITFALLVKDIEFTYDQWSITWNMGLSRYENTDTDTEWTPSLIWDLEGSAATFMKNPFHVYVKDMGFDFVAAFGTSDTPKIAMKSGMCVAREFAIGDNPQKVVYTKNGVKYKAWRLTLGKAEDSSLKTYYPSETSPLADGDNFVIIGIEMPDVYIQAASMKLLVEATKALADVCDTKHDYEPSVDDIYIQRNYDRCEQEGDVTKSVYWKLGAGMKFPFFGIAEEGKEIPDMFTMIIDTLTIKEGEGLTPKITIKLSEDYQQSTLQKLTRQVTSITNGSIFKAANISAGGGLNESEVKAIVSEFTKNRYLSKINPDSAGGVITFLQGLIAKAKSIFKEGIEIGNFVTGWLGGSGAAIDKDGNAEFESIKARGFIETPELRFNRIDVVSGELWNSVCFGTIERVDTDRRLVWLKLEDGELSGIHVNDICRGIFHSINGNNPIKERLDECNFIELAGFATSYFTPTVVYDNGASFKYSLKPGTTVHPQVGMKFAVYGNFTDKSRQASAYQTRTYQRYLNKVDTWVIDPGKNIYMQLGLLDGLTISGYQLKDYGALMHNVYLSGVHIDFDRDFLESITPDVYAMHLTRSNFIVITDLEGNIIGGLKETDNVTANDDGEAANVTANTVGGDDFDNVTVGNVYLMRSTIQAYNGDTQLLYSDHIEEGMFVAELDAHGCKAVADNGIVTITDIDTSAESIYADVRINCEGNVHLTKRIGISVIVEPENGVTADLDNEMTSLPSDDKGNVFAFSPVKVVPRLWYGNDPMVITRAYVEKLPDGITTNVQLVTESGYSYYDIPFVDGVRTLIISGVSQSAADVNELLICVEGKIKSSATNTYTKSTVFKLNKVKMGENAIRYELVPSTNEIIVDKDGNVKTSAVSCQVIELDGKGTATLTTSAQLSARNLTMKVCIYNTSATGSEVGYSIGSNVSIGSTYGGQAFTKDTLKAVFTLYHNGTLIDKEGVPVIRNGVYAVRLDLDNENDSMLYNGNGDLKSGNVVSHATLFDGVTNVNSAVTEWSMQGSTGCNASVSNNTITVTAMSANTGSVTIGAKYLGNIYTAQLTLKKLVGVDKYEIVTTPTSVTKDPNTGKYSHTSITVDVYVTRQNGTREKNPDMGGATLSNNITGVMTPGEAFQTSSFGNNNKQVVFTVTRNGAVEDSETVPLLEAGLNGKKRVVIQPVGGGTRSYTYAQWNSWGAYGHSENWGCSNVNEIVVGDTGVIAGYVSDRGNISATIEGIVTSKGTDTVAMTSLVLTMKGDNGKDAEYNVIEVLSNTVKVGLTGMASGVLSYKVCHIKGSTKTDIQADANFKFIFTGEEHGGKYSGATATFTFDNHKLDPSYITLRYGNTSMVVQPASDGDSYFIINRGVLKTPNTYKYKRNSTTGIWERDYGVYQIGEASYYFMVKNKDTEVTAMPTKAEDDDNWQLMSKYQAVLADTLIGNNCNIGGFLASDEYFVSDSKVTNPKSDSIYDRHNIVLDGKNGKVVANDCKIRGEVNATSGTFENCKITNNCSIEPKNKGGGGWFLRGGKDSDGVDKGAAAWWLGYEGSMPGQFTMENEYGESGYIPAYVRLSFKTPRITSTGSDGGDVIQVYSNISHPLATFSHTYGTTVNICPSEGTGIEFLQSSAAKTPIAFKGTGHGVLNGVIQGYKLNVMTSGLIKISEGNTVYCNGVSTTLALPKLSDCRNVLGTAGAFALDLTIIAASGASNFRVEGSDYSTLTDCKLVSNNHAAWYATMSQGDVLQLKLISNDSTFYAYIVSHIN